MYAIGFTLITSSSVFAQLSAKKAKLAKQLSQSTAQEKKKKLHEDKVPPIR